MTCSWLCSKCGKYQGDGPFYMTSGLLCDKCDRTTVDIPGKKIYSFIYAIERVLDYDYNGEYVDKSLNELLGILKDVEKKHGNN